MTTATVAQWRALHSSVVDAILAQPHAENVKALMLLIGLTSTGLWHALDVGFARIRPELRADTLHYVVEVRADAGFTALVSPSAESLGLPGHVNEDEAALLAAQLVSDIERELLDGDPS